MPLEVSLLLVEQETGADQEKRKQRLSLLKLLRTAKLLRIMKLIKLFRFFRFVRLMSRFEQALFVRYSVTSLAKFVMLLVCVVHWSACAFYYVDDEFCDGHNSWVTAHGLDDERDRLKYLTALYWSFTTITTIGYGDVTAECHAVRGYVMLVMIIGSSLYTYGITYMLTLVQSVNEQTLLFREQMDSINSYIRFREIGDPLRERLREYFSYLLTTDTWRHEFRNEQTILEQLSPDLRRQVVLDVNATLLEHVPLFARIKAQHFPGTDVLIAEIVARLANRLFRPDEEILTEGQFSDALYVLSKGRAEVLKWGRVRIATLEEHASFGEGGFTRRGQSRRNTTVLALTYCDVRYLRRSAFDEVLTAFEGVYEPLTRLLESRGRSIARGQRELEVQVRNAYPGVEHEWLEAHGGGMAESHAYPHFSFDDARSGSDAELSLQASQPRDAENSPPEARSNCGDEEPLEPRRPSTVIEDLRGMNGISRRRAPSDDARAHTRQRSASGGRSLHAARAARTHRARSRGSASFDSSKCAHGSLESRPPDLGAKSMVVPPASLQVLSLSTQLGRTVPTTNCYRRWTRAMPIMSKTAMMVLQPRNRFRRRAAPVATSRLSGRTPRTAPASCGMASLPRTSLLRPRPRAGAPSAAPDACRYSPRSHRWTSSQTTCANCSTRKLMPRPRTESQTSSSRRLI